MKLNIYFFATLLTLFSITSCKKECPIPPPATYPIEGLWTGTYTVDALPSQGALSFNFYVKPGGNILTEGKGGDGKTYYASGIWSLSGSIFTATITTHATIYAAPVTQLITATYSNIGTLTNGTWRDTNNPNGLGFAGKFSTMQRSN